MTVLASERSSRPAIRLSIAAPSIVMDVLAFLAMTLSIAIDSTIASLRSAHLGAMDRILTGGQLPSLRLHGRLDALEPAVETLRGRPEVRAVATRRAHRITLTSHGDAELIVVIAELGLEAMATKGRLRIDGKPPTADALLLHVDTARSLGVGIGDRVVIDQPSPATLQVSGTFQTTIELRGLPLMAIGDSGLVLDRSTLVAAGAEAFVASSSDASEIAATLKHCEGVQVAVEPMLAVTGRMRAAIAMSLELAGWMATILGLIALAAVGSERARRGRERLALHLDLGTPTSHLLRLLAVPTLLRAWIAIGAGTAVGHSAAGSFIAPLAAWTTLQVGHGITLPSPRLEFGHVAFLLTVAALLAAWQASRALREVGERASRRRVGTRRSLLPIAVGALSTSAMLQWTGWTAQHPALRVIGLASAVFGLVLMIDPALAFIVSRLKAPVRFMVEPRMSGTSSGVLPIVRLHFVVAALAMGLGMVSTSLTHAVGRESERRFGGDYIGIPSHELLGLDLGEDLLVEQAPRREAFRTASHVVIDALDEFRGLLLSCGALSLACLIVAEARSRRREDALAADLGAEPNMPARWNAVTYGIAFAVSGALAIPAAAFLAAAWCQGTLRHLLDWRVDFASPSLGTWVAGLVVGAALTACSAWASWNAEFSRARRER
ncbi:MAG: hypothetical protein AB7I19_04445 [Planctomycetota bacterium]